MNEVFKNENDYIWERMYKALLVCFAKIELVIRQ